MGTQWGGGDTRCLSPVNNQAMSLDISPPQPGKDHHKLVCFYYDNDRNPRLILRPQKVEVAFPEPKIYIFRDSITEKQMSRLKALARPKVCLSVCMSTCALCISLYVHVCAAFVCLCVCMCVLYLASSSAFFHIPNKMERLIQDERTGV